MKTTVEKIKCSKCETESNEHNTQLQIFENKTVHVKLVCKECETYLKYVPLLNNGIQIRDFELKFGKYKGYKCSEIDDLNYLLYLFTIIKFSSQKEIIKSRVESLVLESDESNSIGMIYETVILMNAYFEPERFKELNIKFRKKSFQMIYGYIMDYYKVNKKKSNPDYIERRVKEEVSNKILSEEIKNDFTESLEFIVKFTNNKCESLVGLITK